MVKVGRSFDSRLGCRHKVDHAGAGTELNQANLRDAPFFAKTEHARIKIEHPGLVAASQNNVIEFGNL